MRKILLIYIVAAMSLLVAVVSCEKNNASVDTDGPVPPEAARFLTRTVTNTFVVPNVNPASFKIPVGVTNVTNTDRKVLFTYSSQSGAVNGTQYTGPSELTIPAGMAVDSLAILGMYAQYAAGRRDTVKIKISRGDGFVRPNAYSDSVFLILRK